jgi:hypothetical protein
VQILFATRILLSVLRSSSTELPPETTLTLQRTEEALDSTIQKIRSHLENDAAR